MKSIVYIDFLTLVSKKVIKTLKHEDFEVSHCKNFDLAIEELKSNPIQIDAVLCAEKIGNKTCIEFLRVTREKRILDRTTPVIVLGDGQNNAVALQYLVAGAADYISKTIDQNIVLAKLQSLLRISANQNFHINYDNTSKEEIRLLQLLRFDFIELQKKLPVNAKNSIMMDKIIEKLAAYIDKKMINEELKSLNQANSKTDLKI